MKRTDQSWATAILNRSSVLAGRRFRASLVPLSLLVVAPGCLGDIPCEETFTCKHVEAGAGGEAGAADAATAGAGGVTDAADAGSPTSATGGSAQGGAYGEPGSGGDGESTGGREHETTGGTSEVGPEEGGSAGEGGAVGTGGAAVEPPAGGTGQDGSAGEGTGGAGQGNGAGTAGAAPVELECEIDEDCDDGLFCNGLESCEGGQCRAGAAPNCENPDSAHCSAACVEGDSAAECVVAALDKDNDGHGSADCQAAPGDDCNDECDTCYPDAEEVCDGLDNDCNGRADLDDGLTLAGETTSIIADARAPRIAWLAAADSYGLAWDDGYVTTAPAIHVWFQRLSTNGTLIGTPLRVSTSSSSGGNQHYLLAMSAGDSEFGIVYRQESTPNAGTYFQRVSANGGLLGARELLSTDLAVQGALEQVPDGDWFVFWSDAAGIVAGAQVAVTGGVVATGTVGDDTGDNWGLLAAQSADEVALAYEHEGPIYWSRFASGFSASQDVELVAATDPVSYFAFGADASRYGVAASFSVAGSYVPRFWELSSDGQARCGPIDLPAPSGEVAMTGIAPMDGGWLIGEYERQYQSLVYPSLQRVGADCWAPDSPMRLTESTQSSVYGPHVASSPDGVAMVWSGAPGDGTYATYLRVFGSHLCDDPR